jgi:putative cardiolipin synthase
MVAALSACQTIPENYSRESSLAMHNTDHTKLAKTLAKDVPKHFGNSGFIPLFSGHDAITARLFPMQEAEKTIDIQTYIWHDDLTGSLMIYFALAAAERGVRVRLLMDGLRESEWADKMRSLIQHPNIQVRVFNPYHDRTWNWLDYVTRFSEANRRMHNKAFVVDNQVAIVGGRNIGDEYFQASRDLEFADLDVLTMGPVVQEVSLNFDSYWNHDLAVPLDVLYRNDSSKVMSLQDLKTKLAEVAETEEAHKYANLLKDSVFVEELREAKLKTHWARGWVMSDAPEKIRSQKKEFENLIGKKLQPYFKESKKEILLISPYLVPSKDSIVKLKEATHSGIRVVLLTNSFASNDVALVHSAYASYRKPLLEAGVEIFEVKSQQKKPTERKFLVGGSSRAGLHGKAFLFDDEKIFVGSMNLDPRSEYLNTEMGVMIESADFSGGFMTDIERKLDTFAYRVTLEDGNVRWHEVEEGKEIIHTSEPAASGWKRFWYGFVSVFVPESWL